LPHLPKRDVRVFSKFKQIRKCRRKNFTIYQITPETDCVSFGRTTESNAPENNVKPEDVLPPKRPFYFAR
jgi:hypothetical protein